MTENVLIFRANVLRQENVMVICAVIDTFWCHCHYTTLHPWS